ncbi:MAG: S8 family serine peptidase [Thermoflavifilum sp.]|nr:S8 family serine peptidase [Thermoflavifilum sp.]MCL6514737.1 S8 family serine peptidase [Alicyclobacillus sp.]
MSQRQRGPLRLLAGVVALSLGLSPTTLAWGTEHAAAKPVTNHVKKGSHPILSSSSVASGPQADAQLPKLAATQAQTRPSVAGKSTSASSVKVRPSFGSQPKQVYVPGKVIVKFKPGRQVTSLNVGGKHVQLKVEKHLPLVGAQVLQVSSGQSVDAVVAALIKSGAVDYAQPDYKIYPTDLGNSTDLPQTQEPLFSKQWGLQNTGQSGGTPGMDIDVVPAWNSLKTKSLQNIVVAVIDTGVDITHPDLVDHIWTNPDANPDDGFNGQDVHGYDFYHGDGSVFDPQDGDVHGTHVAGIIAAEINQFGTAGIAQNVDLMICKFLGPNGGDDEGAIEAINYAAQHGAKIANASWGGYGYDEALKEAIQDSGMLFVSAAGNDGVNLDNLSSEASFYPAAYDLPNQITVAAIDGNGNMAPFSNYGDNTVQIAAPGTDILSTVAKHYFDDGASVEVTGPATSPSGSPTTYHAVVQGFGLEEFGESDVRADIVKRALTAMGVSQSDPILLVDDDGSGANMLGYPDVEGYYTDALQAAGYDNVTVDKTSGNDGPSAEAMQAYKAVIWFTGDSFGDGITPNLTDTDQANLIAYLKSGGNVYLSGPDVLYLSEQSDLVQNYLHVNVTADGDTRQTLTGSDGSAYADISYSLDGTDISPYNDDLAVTDPSAQVDLYWPKDGPYDQINGYAYLSGTSMAAPFVTGVAALVEGEHPNWSVDEVRQAILATAKPTSMLQNKVSTGGMVDAAAALAYDPLADVPGVALTGDAEQGIYQVTGSFDGSATDNVYAIPLHTGETITVQLATGDNSGTDFDLYLYSPLARTVQSSDGILAYSEQANTSNETITYVAQSDGTYYIDVYDYAGTGAYVLTATLGALPGTYDDPTLWNMLGLGGTGSSPHAWTMVQDKDAYGGSYTSVNDGNAGTFTFYFNGTGVRYLAHEGPGEGVARITIDGKAYDVSLYRPQDQDQVTVYQDLGLSPGEHKMTIEWTGQWDKQQGARKSATTIDLDALVVADDRLTPTAPSHLQGKVDVDNHAVLTWTPSPDINVTQYEIQRAFGKSPKDSDFSTIDTVSSAQTTYTDTSLELSVPYTYRVVAVNHGGLESPPSNTVTLVDTTPPSVPTHLTVTLDGAKHAVLNWTGNTEPDLAGYIIQRAPGLAPKDSSFTNVAVVPRDQTHDVDTSTTVNRIYTYRVIAVDKAGNQSKPASVTVVPPPVTVEDNSGSLKYSSTWTHAKESSDSGGTLSYSTTKGAYVQFTFTGVDIKVLAKTGVDEGYADVYLDGKFVKTVNLYTSSTKYKQVIFQQTGLSETSHTIQIVVKGAHSASSTGNKVTIDAFTYTP